VIRIMAEFLPPFLEIRKRKKRRKRGREGSEEGGR